MADLITAEQMKNLQSELRLYDLYWMDRLVKHFEEKFPDEKEDFTRSKMYSVFLGKKKNALQVTRVYTEATILLQSIKDEFEKTFPKTTIMAFNTQKQTENG